MRASVPVAFPPPLNDSDFELVCLEIFRRVWDAPRLQSFGRRGHAQKGRDLYGVDAAGRLCGIQCKQRDFHRSLTVAEAEAEVALASTCVPPLKKFAIATSAKRDPELQEWAAQLTKDHQAQGLFPVQVYAWDDLVQYLNENYDLAAAIYLGDAAATGMLPALMRPGDFFLPLEDPNRLFHHHWAFVGRELALGEARTFLSSPDVKAAVLCGRGGIGKTALIRAIIEMASHEYPERMVLILQNDSDVSLIGRFRFWGGKFLIVVDDAHRFDQAAYLGSAALRVPADIKLLLVTRPHAVQTARNELMSGGIDSTQLSTFKTLEALSEDECRLLARQALGKEYAAFADRLAALTWDCPLVTVVAGQLVARKQIDVRLLDIQADFRVQVLERFRTQIQDELQKIIDRAVLDRLLPLIAAVSPVTTTNKDLVNAMAAHMNVADHELVMIFDNLAQAGLLIGRGRLLRIAPDVVSDYILRNRCVTANGQPSGYAVAIFNEFANVCAEKVLRNLAELDWRVRQEGNGETDLLNAVWQSIEAQLDGAEPDEKGTILGLLRKVAYFQPAPTMRLLRKLPPVPDADTYPFIPDLLGDIAYNPDYRVECCRMLWELGKDSGKQTFFRSSAFATLVKMAVYSPHVPLELSRQVMEALELVVAGDDALGFRNSPLDVADKFLAKIETSRTSDRFQITMRPFPIPYGPTSNLRERALNIIARAAGHPEPRIQARAAQSLKEVLKAGFMPFGNELTDEQDAEWNPDRAEAMRILSDILGMSQSPVIRLKARVTLQLFAYHNPTSRLAANARNLAAGIAMSAEMELIEVVWSGRHNYDDLDLSSSRTEEKHIDFDAARERWNALAEQRVRRLVESYPKPNECAFALQSLSRQLEAAGFDADVWIIAVHLGRNFPKYAADLTSDILDSAPCGLGQMVGRLIEAVRRVDISSAIQLTIRALNSTDVVVRHSLANRFWIDRVNAPDKREHSLFAKLLADPDHNVRKSAIFSLTWLKQHDKKSTIEFLASVEFNSRGELADEVCGILMGKDDELLAETLPEVIERLVGQLTAVDSLDHHWVIQFLNAAAEKHSKSIFDLLMRRMDQADISGYDKGFEAIPLRGSSAKFVGLANSPELSEMLRAIRDRALVKGEAAAIWVPRVFWWVLGEVQDMRPIDVLVEWLSEGNEEKRNLVSHLLQELPPKLVWEYPEQVSRLLEAAAGTPGALNQVEGMLRDVVELVGKHGAPGRPFPEDEHRLDRSIEIARQLPPGSITRRFYERLHERAKIVIVDHRQRWDEEEFAD